MNLTIKHWDDADKPREKLIENGRKSLSNAELIAILLGSGVPGSNAVEVAKKILRDCNDNLHELSKLEINELCRYKGIGEAKAVSIVAATELGTRMLNKHADSKDVTVKSSQDIFEYICPMLIDLDHEEFWAVYMNVRNKVIYHQHISMGGLTETSVDPRIIFKKAIEKNAVRIAVVHNHPSGHLVPSNADKKLTDQLAKAGEILHIKLLDHLIVGIKTDGEPDYFSFNDNGLI